VNEDRPQEIFARLPSIEKSITADGSDRVMSAKVGPGLKQFRFQLRLLLNLRERLRQHRFQIELALTSQQLSAFQLIVAGLI
jgi:hypothetical protein